MMTVCLRHPVGLLPAAAFLLLAAAQDVSAQPPPPAHEITVCVHDHPDTGGYFTDLSFRTGTLGDATSGSPFDGAAAPNWAVHTRRLMSTFVECSLDFAQTDIVPRVLPWFNGILVIMFVWTGVTVMFSGSASVQTLLSFLLLAAFASGLMHTYYSGSPILNLFGVNQGLVHAVLLGAEVVSETLFEQADAVYYTEFDEARALVVQRNELLITGSGTSIAGIATRISMLTASGAMTGSAAGPVGSAVGGAGSAAAAIYLELQDWANAFAAAVWSLVVTGTMWLFLGILHIAYWIIMAQYMWGYFSMAVIAVVGPLFIPLVLVPQTQDYFLGLVQGAGQFRLLHDYGCRPVCHRRRRAHLAPRLSGERRRSTAHRSAYLVRRYHGVCDQPFHAVPAGDRGGAARGAAGRGHRQQHDLGFAAARGGPRRAPGPGGRRRRGRGRPA